MSDKDLEEKKSAEESAQNEAKEGQVEADASTTAKADEVAETAKGESTEASSEKSSNEAAAASDESTQSIDVPDDVPVEDEVIPVDEFNWDAHESEIDDYSQEDRVKLEDMYAETLSHVDEREVVTGKIVNITDRDVVVNIGFKSDGMVPLSEFKYMGEDMAEGLEVKIMVEKREDSQGQIQLSHKKAIAESAWDEIVDSYENDKILRGHITDRTKGGMVVDLKGLDAFLPGSQIDIKPIKDYDAYVGKTMDLKVVKLNIQYRNIVVSHKAIIESDLEQQKTEILSSLEKGQVLEGVVKNLTSFGVFVDLGGVDGLIHITDVSWGRINHPEEVLELGQKINCVVLDYDESKKRISLGLKQLSEHPWETLPEEIKEESKVKGKVVNIEDYGAFVEIYPGVEGLVHVSEMSWSTHLKSPQEYVNLGDEVEAVVLSIDREARKLALGMKQLSNDPWAGIEEKYPVNSKHTATVRSLTNFGMFMELEEGIDGLVHISDLSWSKKYNHPAEFTKVGEKLEVVILEMDMENRRLSLGIKQLEEDPWDTFETIFLMNSIHEGTLTRADEKGGIVQLPYGLEAYAPAKHLAKKEKGAKVEEGESVKFKVIEFDREARKIMVSHSQIWRDEDRMKKVEEDGKRAKEQKATTKAVKSLQENQQDETLADANEILKGLKLDLEKEELKKQQKAIKEMDQKLNKDDSEEEEATEDKSEEMEEKMTAKKTTKKASTKKKAEEDDKAEDKEDEDKKEKKTTAKKKTTTKKKSTTKAKKEDDKKEDKSSEEEE